MAIIGGMVAGAAPIYAEDLAPPTTTNPPRVQAPTTTTIPSTPPTTTPPRLVAPPSGTNPGSVTTVPTPQPQQQPTTTLPLQAPTDTLPPWESPPELPPDPPTTLPEDFCVLNPDVCKTVLPPIPDFPPQPDTATLPRDFATNDGGAVRDGSRIYRQARLIELAERGASCLTFSCVTEIRTRCVDLDRTVAYLKTGDGWETFCWEGDISSQPAALDETGMTCPDRDCFIDFYTWCWEMGGVIAQGEGEGGYVCKFYIPAAGMTLDVHVAPSSAPAEDDEEEETCFEAVALVCGEIDGETFCIYTAQEVPCEEEDEGGSSEAPAPESSGADASAPAAAQADAGMTCMGGSLDCALFIQYCDAVDGALESTPIGGGGHEMTCHFNDGSDGESAETPGATAMLLEIASIISEAAVGGALGVDEPTVRCGGPDEPPCVDESDPQQSGNIADLVITLASGSTESPEEGGGGDPDDDDEGECEQVLICWFGLDGPCYPDPEQDVCEPEPAPED